MLLSISYSHGRKIQHEPLGGKKFEGDDLHLSAKIEDDGVTDLKKSFAEIHKELKTLVEEALDQDEKEVAHKIVSRYFQITPGELAGLEKYIHKLNGLKTQSDVNDFLANLPEDLTKIQKAYLEWLASRKF